GHRGATAPPCAQMRKASANTVSSHATGTAWDTRLAPVWCIDMRSSAGGTGNGSHQGIADDPCKRPTVSMPRLLLGDLSGDLAKASPPSEVRACADQVTWRPSSIALASQIGTSVLGCG